MIKLGQTINEIKELLQQMGTPSHSNLTRDLYKLSEGSLYMAGFQPNLDDNIEHVLFILDNSKQLDPRYLELGQINTEDYKDLLQDKENIPRINGITINKSYDNTKDYIYLNEYYINGSYGFSYNDKLTEYQRKTTIEILTNTTELLNQTKEKIMSSKTEEKYSDTLNFINKYTEITKKIVTKTKESIETQQNVKLDINKFNQELQDKYNLTKHQIKRQDLIANIKIAIGDTLLDKQVRGESVDEYALINLDPVTTQEYDFTSLKKEAYTLPAGEKIIAVSLEAEYDDQTLYLKIINTTGVKDYIKILADVDEIDSLETDLLENFLAPTLKALNEQVGNCIKVEQEKENKQILREYNRYLKDDIKYLDCALQMTNIQINEEFKANKTPQAEIGKYKEFFMKEYNSLMSHLYAEVHFEHQAPISFDPNVIYKDYFDYDEKNPKEENPIRANIIQKVTDNFNNVANNLSVKYNLVKCGIYSDAADNLTMRGNVNGKPYSKKLTEQEKQHIKNFGTISNNAALAVISNQLQKQEKNQIQQKQRTGYGIPF